ncbi:MAG: 30S ribosomal protein THX [Ignavibacteriales bacterium]|nr:MAG: 30S ribosomal protein THX [Ignavibacteriaceae bacterium]MBW7873877.1 30S ribosomal protein THX [Ignavibacteria bacterium]MCZ2143364.1 30S ribosomal protein THX [Ignavibacteriales bacterium]OQY76374.1 MAG: ribosomal small subunit protein bTHX [Ignavibacteriales bacterium UTCHB3]MBZ0197964.1 30S ribosomal protein THX [Ignavibacteriaceae bacterium]
MGKGDPKTKRGKIFKGSNGKFRPTQKAINRAKKEATAAPAEPAVK